MSGDYTSRKYEELHLLYTVTIADIKEFKQQQWKITNYGLLLYAVIVSISKLFGKLTQVEFWLLFIVSSGIMMVGTHFLIMYEDDLKVRKGRLIEIRKMFTEDFRRAWRGGKSKNQVPDELTISSLLWFFLTVFVIGFLFDIWILIKIYCGYFN